MNGHYCPIPFIPVKSKGSSPSTHHITSSLSFADTTTSMQACVEQWGLSCFFCERGRNKTLHENTSHSHAKAVRVIL